MRAERPSFGGQALVEGVMMRGPRRWALAVRLPGGEIATETHHLPWEAADHPWVRAPFIRGVNVLAESLAIGMRALRISTAYLLSEALSEAETGTGADGVEVSERRLGWAMGIAIA